MNEFLPGLRRDLRPVFEMLLFQKQLVSLQTWVTQVNAVRNNILNAPDQYITDFSDSEDIRYALNILFDEFIEERS